MVYYIRFLSGPVWQAKDSAIVGSVAISSDLRERLLHRATTLTVSIDGSAQEWIEWTPGMYSLKFILKSQAPDIQTVVSVSAQCADGPQIVAVSNYVAKSDTFFREFRLTHNKTLNITERKRESIEGHIWDAGLVLVNELAQAISQHGSSTACVNVLELGCGTGLIGLSLAMLLDDCHVTLTDLRNGSELAELNIAANQFQFAHGSNAKFRTLEWGTTPWLAEYQLVVVGDCIYNPDTHDDLLTTLHNVSAPETMILLASKVRHEAEAAFDGLMLNKGFVEQKRMTVRLPNEENVADEVVHIKTLYKSKTSPHFEWIQDHALKMFL